MQIGFSTIVTLIVQTDFGNLWRTERKFLLLECLKVTSEIFEWW